MRARIQYWVPAKRNVAERRGGFTLVEVMVVSAISLMVLAATVTVLVASQRGLQSAMAQIQMAVELRMLREKLLFRVDDSGGLMSARQSTVQVDGGAGGWGEALRYVPFEGDDENAVSWSEETKKLAALSEFAGGWLSSGRITLDPGMPFRDSARVDQTVVGALTTETSDDQIRVNVDEIHVRAGAVMQVGSPPYPSQRQLIRAQIMAP